MGRLLDIDDFLDPKSLTPQELYKLQSDTWAQGADYENDRIVKLMEEEVRYDFPPIIEMSLDSFKALIRREQK